KNFRMSFSSRTLHAVPLILPPVSVDNSLTVVLTSVAVRLQIATSAPSLSSILAIARPMPRVAPVTIAFFPWIDGIPSILARGAAGLAGCAVARKPRPDGRGSNGRGKIRCRLRSPMQESSVFWLRIAAVLYFFGLVHSLLTLVRRRTTLFRTALATFVVAAILHMVSLVEIARAEGHFPLANFYQSISVC